MPKHSQTTELYLFRHVETVMNTMPHLIGGRSNESPPTPRGIEQAKRLGRVMLAKQIIPIGAFSSPARRTIETAHYSLAEMGLDMEPVIDPDLQELSQGSAEGRLRRTVYTKPVLAEIDRLGKDFRFEDGESMNDVGQRMFGWVTRTFIESDEHGPGRYFVYTHGGAIKYLASYILGWDHDRTYEQEVDNASVSLFLLHDNTLDLAYVNRDVELA